MGYFEIDDFHKFNILHVFVPLLLLFDKKVLLFSGYFFCKVSSALKSESNCI